MENEPAPKLIVDPPLPGPLTQGIFQAQYQHRSRQDKAVSCRHVGPGDRSRPLQTKAHCDASVPCRVRSLRPRCNPQVSPTRRTAWNLGSGRSDHSIFDLNAPARAH
ncbi:MAG TPA: DUF6130 family protein [Hyphomicrobiaceae bacterium]|nr:DUF6130 family protein [Hyphomicrobiaceae bacterium]